MLRAIPKVGTRKKQWLIVNDTGGLVYEMTGSERQATRKAEAIEAKRCECLGTEEPEFHVVPQIPEIIGERSSRRRR